MVVVDQTALPTLLLVGALYWLSSGELQAMAADLSDHQPHFHPLAADMNQIAGEVSPMSSRSPLSQSF